MHMPVNPSYTLWTCERPIRRSPSRQRAVLTNFTILTPSPALCQPLYPSPVASKELAEEEEPEVPQETQQAARQLDFLTVDISYINSIYIGL